jgi:hypothetical protein
VIRKLALVVPSASAGLDRVSWFGANTRQHLQHAGNAIQESSSAVHPGNPPEQPEQFVRDRAPGQILPTQPRKPKLEHDRDAPSVGRHSPSTTFRGFETSLRYHLNQRRAPYSHPVQNENTFYFRASGDPAPAAGRLTRSPDGHNRKAPA